MNLCQIMAKLKTDLDELVSEFGGLKTDMCELVPEFGKAQDRLGFFFL